MLYLIVAPLNGAEVFYTGSDWSAEYPEAKLYKSLRLAGQHRAELYRLDKVRSAIYTDGDYARGDDPVQPIQPHGAL